MNFWMHEPSILAKVVVFAHVYLWSWDVAGCKCFLVVSIMFFMLVFHHLKFYSIISIEYVSTVHDDMSTGFQIVGEMFVDLKTPSCLQNSYFWNWIFLFVKNNYTSCKYSFCCHLIPLLSVLLQCFVVAKLYFAFQGEFLNKRLRKL